MSAWGHLVSEESSSFHTVFPSNVKPHVSEHIVFGNTFAMGIHKPKGVLRTSCSLLRLPVGTTSLLSYGLREHLCQWHTSYQGWTVH